MAVTRTLPSAVCALHAHALASPRFAPGLIGATRTRRDATRWAGQIARLSRQGGDADGSWMGGLLDWPMSCEHMHAAAQSKAEPVISAAGRPIDALCAEGVMDGADGRFRQPRYGDAAMDARWEIAMWIGQCGCGRRDVAVPLGSARGPLWILESVEL